MVKEAPGPDSSSRNVSHRSCCFISKGSNPSAAFSLFFHSRCRVQGGDYFLDTTPVSLPNLRIQALDLLCIFIIDHFSFHFHGGCHFSALDGEFLRNNDKFLYGLNPGK